MLRARLLLLQRSCCLFAAMASRAEAASGSCPDAADVTVLPSPVSPWKGAPLRVMVVSEKPVQGVLSLIAPDGSVAAKSARPARRVGALFLVRRGRGARLRHVARDADARPRAGGMRRDPNDIAVSARSRNRCASRRGLLAGTNSWNTTTEALYGAWIEKLFDAPPDKDLNWKVWSEVLHDRSRNFLFNHLGRGEDDGKSGLRPDCADFVYFLRAYFAYKMGLPFGYSNCSRGFGGRPPKCAQWFDMEHPELTRPPAPPERSPHRPHRARHGRPRRA